MLYADSYLSRDEFRSMFDHTLLDKLRKATKAERAFPEPFAKVCHKAGSTADAATGKALKNAAVHVTYGGGAFVTRKLTSEAGLITFGGWAGKAKPTPHNQLSWMGCPCIEDTA